jgi:hypothetical protein
MPTGTGSLPGARNKGEQLIAKVPQFVGKFLAPPHPQIFLTPLTNVSRPILPSTTS